MKRSCYFPVLLVFIFLLSTLETTARLIPTKQGLEEGKVNETSLNYLAETEVNGAIDLKEHNNEVEDCETGDEKCLVRMMAEVFHKDYIYTQDINENKQP